MTVSPEILHEPLLSKSDTDYTLFPIEFPTLYDFGKKAQASIWTTEEIDLTQDIIDFQNKLNDDERHYVKSVLAFFAASDGVVLENLMSNFTQEVAPAEAQFAFAVNAYMEAVHSETYSTLIDTLITDQEEKKNTFKAVETNSAVKAKHDFAKRYLNNEMPFAERCVAFCCVEGILFSGSFCALFWLKKRGLMPGLTFSNELISRDEGIHTDLGVEIHSLLNNKCPPEKISQIIKEAVKVETDYVENALPVSLIGMNKTLMSTYIKFVANRLSKVLGIENGVFPDSEAYNPFDWMELISLQGKTNFFEKRVSDYALSSTAGEKKFAVDDDF